MQAVQNLAIFFLICQFLSGIMLVLGVQFDEIIFINVGVIRFRTRPGIIKSARLFGSTQRPLFMTVYLLSLIFVLFSYFANLLLVGQFIFLLIS